MSFNYLSKNNFLNFIIFITPISFTLGRFFVELILVISSIFFFLNINRFKITYLKKNIVIFSLFFYFLFILLSTIHNYEVLKNTTDQNLLLKSILNFRFIIYILSLWMILEEVKFNKNFFWLLLFFFSFIIIDGLFQFINGKNFFGVDIPATGRVSGVFADENILGSYIQKISPIILTLSLILFNIDKTYKKLLTIFIIICTLLLILTGDRSPILLTLLFFFLSILILKNLRKNFIFAFLFVSITLMLISKFNIGKNLMTLKQRYDPSSHYNQRQENNYENLILKKIPKDYIGHILVVNEMIKDNFYLGKGLKSFRYMCRGKLGNFYPIENGVCSTHPHNYYLQSLSAAGILGFVSLFVIFIFFLRKIFDIFTQRKNYCLPYISIIITMFMYFWPLIPTGNFFSNWIAGFNCYGLALFLYINSLQNNKKIN